MTNVTALPATQQDQTTAIALVMDYGAMEKMMAAAHIMASARVTVPKHLQGSEGDCLAVIMQAAQWRMNPFAVAQKTHVVNGTLGYEAQLVNAVVQASGAINGHFHYEYRGQGLALECRVGAVIRGETAITWNEWLRADSVTTKNSPLWKTNPKQQLGYLQVKNWARAYCPGAILGVYSTDELEAPDMRDMGPADVVPGEPQEPEIISRIAAAESLADLEALRKDIKALTGEDKQKALAAAKTRAEEIRAATQSAPARATTHKQEVDHSTGEVFDAPTDVLTYADVADALSKAKDADALADAADRIRMVPDAGHRTELTEIYKRRYADIGAAA